MSSAWRSALVATGLIACLAVALVNAEERKRTLDPGEPRAEYDGRFAFTRIRYGARVGRGANELW